ncbi:MAG: hypothetical protein RIE58_06620 [Vicingaceae bacterium]
MKVLMFGPGKGNNIALFLNYFDENSEHHQLTYGYFTKQAHFNLRSTYRKVHFFPAYSIYQLIKGLRADVDLIWIHNWTPLPLLILIVLFAKRGSVLNLNVWSETLPKLWKTNHWKAVIYRSILKKVDVVQCNWYGTLDLVNEIQGIDPVLLPWGLDDENFNKHSPKMMGQETTAFVASLDRNKIKFFFPKSISRSNRHDIVIDASKNLLASGYDQFQVYIWPGNHIDKRLMNELQERIINQGLGSYVIIVDHLFVKNYEMKYIWEHMDCGLNVIEADQLSASFIEPQLYKKELIASNISAYRHYEKKYGLQLDLIQPNVDEVARRMVEILDGRRTQDLELRLRKKQVEVHYCFSKCLDHSLNYLVNQGKGAV